MAKMGFSQDTKVTTVPLVEENFTNAICYGKTGSGKTTGFILPNIENRIKLGHGILIYDFKGTLHEQVKVLASKHNKLDDVIEIGKPWAKSINILKYISSKMLREMYVNIAGETNDTYWRNASSNLLSSVCIIYKEFELINKLSKQLVVSNELLVPNEFVTTFRNIYNSVKSVQDIVNFLDMVEEVTHLFERKLMQLIENMKRDNDFQNKELLKTIVHSFDNIKKSFDSLKIYHELNPNNSGETGGKYAVLNHLNSSISNTSIIDFINKDEIDIVDALNDGKIVVINIGNIDELILGMLNVSIYKRLQMRVLESNPTPITIFIDEAQKVLSENYIPEVDVCRESKFEYIFSTQDEVLLSNKIGENKTKELTRNLVEQYSFATNQDNDTVELKTFEYKNLINQKTRYTDPVFLDKDELFQTEYLYQNKRGYLDFTNTKSSKPYILLYIPELYEQSEAYLKFEDMSLEKTYICVHDDTILQNYSSKSYPNKEKSDTLEDHDELKIIERKLENIETTIDPEDRDHDLLVAKKDILIIKKEIFEIKKGVSTLMKSVVNLVKDKEKYSGIDSELKELKKKVRVLSYQDKY